MASATPDLWLPSQPKLVFIAPTHTGMARLSCPLVSDNRKKCLSPNFTESEKLILKSHPDLDQHHNLTTSRRSPLAHAYHVWSTSINAFGSYPAHRQNNGTNDRQNE